MGSLSVATNKLLLFRQVFTWQIFERLQNAVGSGIHSNRRAIAPGDGSLLIDDEQSSLTDSIDRAVGAILPGNGSLGLKIGEQREMQMTGRGECIVTPGTVHRHPQQFRSELSKLGEDLVVKSHLVATYRAPVRGGK